MGRKIEHFTDVEAWKHAHRLAIDIYDLTKDFPKEEVFGLTGQIRRAAASVTANIAEGMGRYSYKERVRFLYNSRGSISEVENFAILARDLGFLKEEEFNGLKAQIEETRKTLSGFINTTERLSIK